MTVRLSALTDVILERSKLSPLRYLIGIAGPPGAGKSTLADDLLMSLRERGETVEILPMDGFHMDNAILQERGLLARKGSPQTFDVRGLIDILRAVRSADQEVLVPVFDRSREIAISSARAISSQTRFVIVEGNYLLLKDQPWARLSGMFDLTIFVGPEFSVLEKRLLDRWKGYGLSDSEAYSKSHGNDLPNGRLVIDHSHKADVIFDTWSRD